MKKLIPALCMLLIAAALMGTSTFAWFSMNSTVAATGMTVRAVAGASIDISDNGTTYGAAITLNSIKDSNAKFDPLTVTKVNGGAPTASLAGTTAAWSDAFGDSDSIGFYKTKDTPTDSANAMTGVTSMSTAIEGSSVGDHFTAVSSTDGSQYVKSEIYLKLSGSVASSAVGMTVTVTGGTTTPVAIAKALHIGFYDNTAKKFYNIDVGSASPAVVDTKYTYTITVESFLTLTRDTPLQLTMYAWYEGEDSDCTTANAISVEDLAIAVSFTKAA